MLHTLEGSSPCTEGIRSCLHWRCPGDKPCVYDAHTVWAGFQLADQWFQTHRRRSTPWGNRSSSKESGNSFGRLVINTSRYWWFSASTPMTAGARNLRVLVHGFIILALFSYTLRCLWWGFLGELVPSHDRGPSSAGTCAPRGIWPRSRACK